MAGWTCTSCGNENPEGTRFCGHCGAAAEATATAEAAPAVDEALRSFVSTQVAERLEEAGGTIPEERRLITALFADISGFTPLADRLDPEELLEVIDPVVSSLSSIVARYDGYVEKYAGDALLALFGAPVSHDDDAERAVRVAAEMHEELARMRDRLPDDAQGLTLHVGVNSGHGIARILGSEARTDYAVLGDAVILAQRLESAAPPGETYVSDATYQLTRTVFEFEDVGELTLKGKSQTVRAWRVVGERAEQPRATTRLIGRADELQRLESMLEDVAGGRGRVASITGEPGVGKSRLTWELEQRALERGIDWLHARCISYGTALPYWPYVELLRRTGPPGENEPASPFFAQLLGLGGDGAVADLEPEAFRRGLHAAFADWFAARAAERPVVLALEDVHWTDEASASLTQDLVERLADAPLGFVLNGRPEAERVLAELPRPRVELALEPLGLDEVESFAADILGAPPPRDLITLLAARTGGNPFFAEELVRALQDTGTLVHDDGDWRMKADWSAGDVPPTIEGVVSARIDLLPRRAATLLQTAAVIGRRQRLALLEAVADDADLREPLDQLTASGLLEPTLDETEPAYEFHHVLVADVAYSRLLRRRRRELHLRVADEAEMLYGAGDDTVGLLARHLYLANAGDRAVDYLLRAGRLAKRLYANEEAIQHLERAIELAPLDTGIRLELADVSDLVGDYDRAERLFGEAREDGQIEAWTGLAAVLRKQGRYDEGLAVVDEALHADPLEGSDFRALWLERARTLTLSGHVEEAVDAAAAGVAISNVQDVVRGRLLLHLAEAEQVAGKLDAALEHGLAARAVFVEVDDPRDLATSLRVLGDIHRQADRLDDAADVLREGLVAAERIGSVEDLGGCLINLGIVEALRGRIDEGIELEQRAAEEFERIGHGAGRATPYLNIAEMLMLRGDIDAALAEAERAHELGTEINNAVVSTGALELMATIRLRTGDYVGAGELGERAAGESLAAGLVGRARDSLEVAAQAYEQAGEAERALALAERARSLQD
jgi:adenylate cyclase